jgi:hypothetical protein
MLLKYWASTAIKSCGITGLGSGRLVEGLGNGGNFAVVVFAVAFFVVAVFGFAFAVCFPAESLGFAFACAIGFDLCGGFVFLAEDGFFAVAGFALVFVVGLWEVCDFLEDVVFAFAIIVISFGSLALFINFGRILYFV